MGKRTGAPRATGPDKARRTNAGPRGSPQSHSTGHNHSTSTGAKPQRPAGAANPGSVHNTQQTAARGKMPRTAGPPRPHTAPTASGPRPHAPKDEQSEWESARPLDAPHTGKRHPPPGALVPPPQRAKPARKSARCGVGDGSPRPPPPHLQPVGSGPRPHAPKDERSGVGQRPTPDAPHAGRRRPPLAPSCRSHSAQSQLARARAGGLVTGPHARTACTHSQWVVGPGSTSQRTSGRGGRAPDPRRPTPRQEAPPPRAPSCHPHGTQSQLAGARAVGWCWVPMLTPCPSTASG